MFLIRFPVFYLLHSLALVIDQKVEFCKASGNRQI